MCRCIQLVRSTDSRLTFHLEPGNCWACSKKEYLPLHWTDITALSYNLRVSMRVVRSDMYAEGYYNSA